MEHEAHRAGVTVEVVDPTDGRAEHCLARYFAELDTRMATGFDPDASLTPDPDEVRAPRGAFLLATLRGTPVGCAALKLPDAAPAEVKRMWVDPTVRGRGLARRLLAGVEARAVAAGRPTLRLDTNGVLTAAIALYRSAGYVEVPPFNDEPHADHWFEKRLSQPSRADDQGVPGTT